MGKFLAFVLSPFKWIICICHLIYLDFRFSFVIGYNIPIIDSLFDGIISCWIDKTIKERKKFDFDYFYNNLKEDYLVTIEREPLDLYID